MKLLKSIGNLFLAVLLMISTMGMTINKHYCMGELKAVSVNKEANSCMNQMQYAPEDFMMDCCEDTSEEYKVDDFSKITQKVDFTPDFYELAMISYLLVDLELVHSSTEQTPYPDYLSPPIERDIPVMIQSFLL